MILYIYGDNSFAINRQLQAIRQKYIAKNGEGADFVKYDLNRDSIEKLLTEISVVPMFAASRLVFVENAATSKPQIGILEKIVTSVPESTNLVFTDIAPDKRTVAFKLLSKLEHAKQFKAQPTESLPAWLQDEAKKVGASLDYQVARHMVDYIGPDQWRLHNELTKLVDSGEPLTKDLVNNLCSPSFDSSAFQLAEALVRKKSAEALKIYSQLKLEGSADQQIQGAIIYQYRMILLASLGDSGLSSAYKANPYSLQKARALSKGIDMVGIKKAYDLIAKADLAVKTGEAPAQNAMRELFYNLCK